MNEERRLSISSQIPATPVQPGLRVPPGHVVVNSKWIGTPLAGAITGHVRVIYEDSMGVVDFHPSVDMAVIYLTENDLVSGTMYKRKLVKLRKAQTVRGIVFAEKTPISSQYFPALQTFAVQEIGLILFPVGGQDEGAQLLCQMVVVESKSQSNPFLTKSSRPSIDSCVLHTMQLVPKLGEVKARALLENFHSIRGISGADFETLSKVVGNASAVNVQKFLKESAT